MQLQNSLCVLCEEMIQYSNHQGRTREDRLLEPGFLRKEHFLERTRLYEHVKHRYLSLPSDVGSLSRVLCSNSRISSLLGWLETTKSPCSASYSFLFCYFRFSYIYSRWSSSLVIENNNESRWYNIEYYRLFFYHHPNKLYLILLDVDAKRMAELTPLLLISWFCSWSSLWSFSCFSESVIYRRPISDTYNSYVGSNQSYDEVNWRP